MSSCVMRKCTNYASKTNKADGITYHKFPTDEIRLQEWIAIVRAQRNERDWMPSKSSRVCSDHFEAAHKYSSKKGRTLLMNNAFPIIKDRVNQSTNIRNSPTSLDDVSISDMEEIFETPIKAALRKRVRLLTFQRNQLRKRNKLLTQQNQRLKKRVAMLLKAVRSGSGVVTKKILHKQKPKQLESSIPFIDDLTQACAMSSMIPVDSKDEQVQYSS